MGRPGRPRFLHSLLGEACWFDLTGFDRLRGTAPGERHDNDRQRAAEKQKLDDSGWTQCSALTLG